MMLHALNAHLIRRLFRLCGFSCSRSGLSLHLTVTFSGGIPRVFGAVWVRAIACKHLNRLFFGDLVDLIGRVIHGDDLRVIIVDLFDDLCIIRGLPVAHHLRCLGGWDGHRSGHSRFFAALEALSLQAFVVDRACLERPTNAVRAICDQSLLVF